MEKDVLIKNLEEINTILQKIVVETKDKLDGDTALCLGKLVRALGILRYKLHKKKIGN